MKLKTKEIISLLLNQLKSPLIYILLVAAFVTLILQEYTDLIVISASIIISTGFGFYQEYKAHDTVEKLKSYIKSKSLVERNGKVVEIDSKDLKIGDIALMTVDYHVPADGKMIEGDVVVDEKILTGESIPVNKGEGDLVFQSTNIISGFGKMIVETLGEKTKFGEISKHVTETKEPLTPLQIKISSLAKIISYVVFITTLGVFLIGLYYQYPLYEMLTISIAIAVATVPEGLVIALTVILAVGMRTILKEKAVVKKLVSAETLGSVTTICLDKTGTITKGVLHVEHSHIQDPKMLEIITHFANIKLDVLEKATHDWVTKEIGKLDNSEIEKYEKIDYLPFNSSNKFTSALVQKKSGGKLLLVYGAAEILLDESNLNKNEKESWNKKIEHLSNLGAKVIGYGYKMITKDKQISSSDISKLEFIGILGLSDPIRKGIKDTLAITKKAGIKIKLITGDHLATALNIAMQAGLVCEKDLESTDCYMEGEDIEKIGNDELYEAIKNVTVFARISPIEKFRIIETLSKNGEVVAMTGDGVNDAPALKRAAIGIVVNEASDVSKEVADIVLLDSNLNTIVKSIKEGRRIYANIKKVILYLLSSSMTELVLVISSIIFKLPLAITAAQILWINLIEDSLPALSLAMEPAEDNIMEKPPIRKKGDSIISKGMLKIMIPFILITDTSALLLFLYLMKSGMTVDLKRTVVFAILSAGSLLYIFSCKSFTKPLFTYNPFSNKHLNLAFLFGISMLIISIYIPFLNNLLSTVPLSFKYWLIIIAFGIFNLLVIEGLKYLYAHQKFKKGEDRGI